MSYLYHLLVYLSVYVIGALGMNLIAGYAGLLALSYAAYFAIGGYVCALAMVVMGWGFPAAAALSVLTAMMLSLAVAIPSMRYGGDLFVIVSLAVQTLVFGLIYNWTSPERGLGSLSNLTNGPLGIAGIPRPNILGHRFTGVGEMAVLSMVLTVGCAAVTWRLVSSPWGRLSKCVRDDALAARGLGKLAGRNRIEVFAIGCGLAALAGALYATYIGYIDPSIAALDQSVVMLSVVIIGGLGNFRGPVVGVLVLLCVPEALRFLPFSETKAASLRLLLYGVLLLAVVHARPQGIAGEYRLE
jgi:branched-chain amino acid transport system permease protein